MADAMEEDDDVQQGREAEGEVLGAEAGRVIADLGDEDDAAPPSDSDDDEGHAGRMEDGEDGAAGASTVTPSRDDSWHCFEGHSAAVMCVAWNPVASTSVASGGMDDRGYLWQVGQEAFEAGAATHELAGYTDTVTRAAYNARGTILATASMSGQVMLWDAASGARLQELEGPTEAIEWLVWHPVGDVILAGSEDYSVWMWSAGGKPMNVFNGHSEPVTCGTFTPDGKLVVTAAYDGAIKVWNPKTGECQLTLQRHPFHESGITCLDVHHNSQVALTGDDGGGLRLSNLATGRLLGELTGHDSDASIEGVRFCAHLPLAVSAAVDGKLIVWDVQRLAPRSVCTHPAALSAVDMHPTQPLCATACADAVARVWDLRAGAVVGEWSGHSAALQAIAFSPDGAQLLTGSDDHTVRLFRLADRAGTAPSEDVAMNA